MLITLLYGVTLGIFYLGATHSYHEITSWTPIRLAMLVLFAPLLVKFAFQLVCVPLYTVKELRARRGSRVGKPRITVIVPAWNEEVGILRTVESILEADYPEIQLIVANDGSSDGTHAVMKRRLRAFAADPIPGRTLTYLPLENGGKARALNRALRHATGDIVVTIDADSIVAPDAIAAIARRFDDPRVGAVAGNVIVANGPRPIALMQQLEYLYGFFFKRCDSLFDSVYIVGGAAAAYRREVLDEVGAFDPTIITEDIEMSMRILARGHKTRYAPDAIVYTEGPSDLKGLCDQRLRWKFGRLRTFLRHRELFFGRSSAQSPYLRFFLLPMALYAEALLLAEGLMLLLFTLYTVQTSDYLPFIFVILLLSAVICIQIQCDPQSRFHRNLFLLAPISWALLFFTDVVELQALVRSLKRLVSREKVQWQEWKRVGLIGTRVTGDGLPTGEDAAAT
jgi:cellulose synthase/poly-beta-1,6-N-acetylglucosamine synthase-like glycosyltransferase